MLRSTAARLISLPNLGLSALVVLVGAGAFVNQGTLAGFTATATNPTNTISTASLDLTAVPSGGANGGSLNLAINDLVPGDYVRKGIAVTNTGDIPANLTLAISDANPGGSPSNALLKGTDANNSLHLTIEKCTDNTYTTCGGSTGYVAVGGSNVNGAAIGSLLGSPSAAMAESKSGGGSDVLYFRVTLQLPTTADNTVKSLTPGEKQAAFTFTWTLSQVGTGTDRSNG